MVDFVGKNMRLGDNCIVLYSFNSNRVQKTIGDVGGDQGGPASRLEAVSASSPSITAIPASMATVSLKKSTLITLSLHRVPLVQQSQQPQYTEEQYKTEVRKIGDLYRRCGSLSASIIRSCNCDSRVCHGRIM